MRKVAGPLTGAIVVALFCSAACSRDPQARARKYAASGDAYAGKQQPNQALIEYKRAVQAKPDWPEAHYKLAKAYDAQGDLPNAYREYARTADLEPSNIEAQMHAGTL